MQSSPPQIQPDPQLILEQQQAQNDLAANLQTQTQGDMANLMSRYGTMLALAGNKGVSPLSISPGLR